MPSPEFQRPQSCIFVDTYSLHVCMHAVYGSLYTLYSDHDRYSELGYWIYRRKVEPRGVGLRVVKTPASDFSSNSQTTRL